VKVPNHLPWSRRVHLLSSQLLAHRTCLVQTLGRAGTNLGRAAGRDRVVTVEPGTRMQVESACAYSGEGFGVDLIWFVLHVVAKALVTTSQCKVRNFECSGRFQKSMTIS